MYLEKIKEARENIKGVVTKTPLLYSNVFSKIYEHMNETWKGLI